MGSYCKVDRQEASKIWQVDYLVNAVSKMGKDESMSTEEGVRMDYMYALDIRNTMPTKDSTVRDWN